ncbi:uncharacterized protein [Struthio camelus]|uniref:uncharacterized protein isoform X2 n=1 Tax=Struthio camelus TaxID=8801 RepID=UPI003603B6A6
MDVCPRGFEPHSWAICCGISEVSEVPIEHRLTRFKISVFARASSPNAHKAFAMILKYLAEYRAMEESDSSSGPSMPREGRASTPFKNLLFWSVKLMPVNIAWSAGCCGFPSLLKILTPYTHFKHSQQHKLDYSSTVKPTVLTRFKPQSWPQLCKADSKLPERSSQDFPQGNLSFCPFTQGQISIS